MHRGLPFSLGGLRGLRTVPVIRLELALRELLFKDGDTHPFLFTNTFFDYVFYNTLGKNEIRRLVNR